ncbi:S-type pyocin domain-containing protein [Pseudomonas hamedanensis]|uniref:S-type pyocin domain-containing protein n=2 Tax=Pseudomonas hamedanensis TaxID=2745504 RepID=A0A9E6TIY7_9PSED|nr:S-type pyocin domain-containing protein [Pseudomonas hamedanensis]
MQKPPPWELTEPVHTTAIAPDHINPARPSIGSHRYNGTFSTTRNSARYQPILQSHIGILEREFQTSTTQIPQTLEAQLAATRQEESTHPLPPAAAIIRELGVRNKLIQRKSAELQHQTHLSHGFYGSDPTNKSADQFLSRAQVVDKTLRPDGPGMTLWKQSYRAALQAKLLTRQLALLHEQQVNVHNWLAAVQANDHAQAAAAEAARQAAEQARIAAEQQRQRDIAEAARRQREQAEIRAREQARLAALAEQQRVAAEQARIAAEQKRLRDLVEAARLEQEQTEIRAREQVRLAALAEQRRLAAEQARAAAETARINAEAEAQEKVRTAALKAAQAEAEARAAAAEQSRLQAEMEQRIDATQQQSLHPAEMQQVYPASGPVASTAPAFSFASTAIRLSPATSSAILTAMRTALMTVTATGAALFGSPVLIGFAAVLMPSRLGNGERFAVSVPFSELSSESAQTLREIADRQGALEMAVGLGVRPSGIGAEVFVASTDNFHIRSSVLVLNAAYDLLNDVYELALPHSPTDFLTWTPATSPGDSSTESPMVDTDSPAYSGAPIVPLEGRLDLNPILVEGWERFIIVFPDDSGIAPLYVVFSDPYEGATVKGKYSGRGFNPEQAGGPILDLDWHTATITRSGIDAVKLHIARLDQSDANEIMIQRLERILSGDRELTDTDLRYYTHEIRELERFRAMQLTDDFKPDSGSPVWNNAHAATLEDYKLGSDEHVLYSPDAVRAGNSQTARIYEQLVKGTKQ